MSRCMDQGEKCGRTLGRYSANKLPKATRQKQPASLEPRIRSFGLQDGAELKAAELDEGV